MKTRIYTTPKAGLEDFQNEDAVAADPAGTDALLIRVADGASTGVFSREWSRHLCHNFEADWMQSEQHFEDGLENLRESFQPEITRPSALRKFLMEGSYATLLTALVQKTDTIADPTLQLTLFAVGDVSLFVFNRAGEPMFTFPYKAMRDFNNVPNLIRSKAALQAKTPYKIAQAEISSQPDELIVMATDALSEFIFKTVSSGNHPNKLLKMLQCKDDMAFKEVIDIFRNAEGMKNDDVAVCFLTARPDLYFQ